MRSLTTFRLICLNRVFVVSVYLVFASVLKVKGLKSVQYEAELGQANPKVLQITRVSLLVLNTSSISSCSSLASLTTTAVRVEVWTVCYMLRPGGLNGTS